MTFQTFELDAGETLDYTVDWGTKYLGSDTIATSAFSVPSGITKVTDSNTTTVATVQLTGAAPLGSSYDIENTITTTTSGETVIRNFTIYMAQKTTI